MVKFRLPRAILVFLTIFDHPRSGVVYITGRVCLLTRGPPVTLELRSSLVAIVPRSKNVAKRGESVANYCFCADTATAVRRYRVLIAHNKHSPRSVSRSTPRSYHA